MRRLKKILVGSRASRLARVQADLFARRASEKGVSVEFKFVSTNADSSKKNIRELGPQAFTKELDGALLSGEIDLAVHSLKDVEIELPAGLEVCYVFGRADARDCLVSKGGKKLPELAAGAKVGCSSARRVSELLHLRKDVAAKPIRGNVPTRVEKTGSEYDAVVLAVAGLQRLGLEGKIAQVFSIDEMVPAAGQGALGVVCRKGEDFGFRGGENFEECFLEREFARDLGACRNAVGAFCEKKEGGKFELAGLVYKNGKRLAPKFAGTKKQVFAQMSEWKSKL